MGRGRSRVNILREVKENRKRREYAKLMEEKRQREKEQLVAMEMLLGAKWTGKYFLRQTNGAHGGQSTYWVEYFDKEGNPLTPKQAADLRGGRPEWQSGPIDWEVNWREL